MPKLRKLLKKGVKVTVTSGKYKGETGEVVKVDNNKQRVFLNGVNEKLDYTRSLLDENDMGPKLKNLGVHISNVAIDKESKEKNTKTKSTKKSSTSKKKTSKTETKKTETKKTTTKKTKSTKTKKEDK